MKTAISLYKTSNSLWQFINAGISYFPWPSLSVCLTVTLDLGSLVFPLFLGAKKQWKQARSQHLKSKLWQRSWEVLSAIGAAVLVVGWLCFFNLSTFQLVYSFYVHDCACLFQAFDLSYLLIFEEWSSFEYEQTVFSKTLSRSVFKTYSMVVKSLNC